MPCLQKAQFFILFLNPNAVAEFFSATVTTELFSVVAFFPEYHKGLLDE